MDYSNRVSSSLPTTAWPRPNDIPSGTPTNPEPPTAVSLTQRKSEWIDDLVSTPYPQTPHTREDLLEPATAVSLPQRRSEWVDDDVSTAYPQTARPREDLLARFLPLGSSQVAKTQAPNQPPTSANPPTQISYQTTPTSKCGTEDNRRVSSTYSEYDFGVPLSARFKRDLQEVVDSPSSIYADSAFPRPLRVPRDSISAISMSRANSNPEPSRSSRNIMHRLTQSPVSKGKPELFPEYKEDTSVSVGPQINLLPNNPSQQQPAARSNHQNYQPQVLAPPVSSKSKPQTRTTRSSSILTGLDQGIYRPEPKNSQNPNNRDHFYATQKDDSRFGRHHPSSREYIHRRRASSLDRTSVPTDPEVAKFWDERLNAGQQPFTPTHRVPTYQEFRKTTQRVDTPSSDQFPLPASALFQYEKIPSELRPPHKSDWKFDPKLVQQTYEERWKITEGYKDLLGYFSVPKEGPYKKLNFKEWVELFDYLEERDQKARLREIVLDLRAA